MFIDNTGVKISENSTDLAILVGVISSVKDRIIPYDTVFSGEIGLNGEIHPVATTATPA